MKPKNVCTSTLQSMNQFLCYNHNGGQIQTHKKILLLLYTRKLLLRIYIILYTTDGDVDNKKMSHVITYTKKKIYLLINLTNI